MRKTIGTVNTAEFLITTAISATFILTIGFEAFTIVTAGLLIGGIIAAPFGAIVARFVPTKVRMLMVGFVLTGTSLFSFYRAMS